MRWLCTVGMPRSICAVPSASEQTILDKPSSAGSPGLDRAPPPTPVRLVSLSTAVPPHVLHQRDVVEQAHRVFAGSSALMERLTPVYANAGVETRYSCVPLDWYLQPRGWKERNALYLDNAVALLADAAENALAEANVAANRVDAVVVVSSTGVATPSLDARLIDRLGLRPDVQRLPVCGLGCAGGVLGLARASAMARATPGSMVLFLVVELCGLTFRSGDASKSNIIATALFGDGAAAMLVSSDPDASGPQITGWGEHTWPASLDVMGFVAEEDGLGILLSRDVPAIVRERCGAAVETFLDAHELTRADLDGIVCHPGGAKVLDALEEVFGLPPGHMSDARTVLRDYGNMSAATVMFILDRALRRGISGRNLVTALGPGFTAAFALLEAA